MFHSMIFRAILWMALPMVTFACPAAAQPLQILVFGDSLSSGFDLEESQGFPAVLKRKLLADGYDVMVWNGSNAGDTSADGLARIDLALEHHPDLVIVEFGANDMLDGVHPKATSQNLDAIISIIQAHGARVILAGMLSLPKNGPHYVVGFNNIYPALARARHLPLYPFFLEGVYGHSHLMMDDKQHPNALGVVRMVAGIAPLVERSLKSIGSHKTAEVAPSRTR
jgi:acyl-CoA thioesterase I